MTTDNDTLKKIFETYRNDIPDNGFTEKVKDRLPSRPSFLPQILTGICMATGLLLVVLVHGMEPIIDNLFKLALSIGGLQVPSMVSVMTYLSILFYTGMISYALITTD
jgi:hypothetical protein